MAGTYVLHTGRLALRTFTPDDAAFYFGLTNQPSWIANIGDRGLRPVEAAREALVTGICAMQQELGYAPYVIERRGDGAQLGLCGLIKRDFLPDTDIGYALLPQYVGQGYAYEAAGAVVDHAHMLGLRRLLGVTSPDNLASNRLLQKLGLRLEKVIQIKDDGSDTNLYSCLLPLPRHAPN